jgi:hypothetical protein
MRLGKLGEPLASYAYQSKHPDKPIRLKEIHRDGTCENWRKESVSLSDTPQPLSRGKVFGKKRSSRGHPGRRRAASRNQRNWFAAIAGAMTWRRVSSTELPDAHKLAQPDRTPTLENRLYGRGSNPRAASSVCLGSGFGEGQLLVDANFALWHRPSTSRSDSHYLFKDQSRNSWRRSDGR